MQDAGAEWQLRWVSSLLDEMGFCSASEVISSSLEKRSVIQRAENSPCVGFPGNAAVPLQSSQVTTVAAARTALTKETWGDITPSLNRI